MTGPPALHTAEATLEAVRTGRHAAYPAYRPSGIRWLGDVPEHWEVKRLKFLSRINPSASEIKDLNDEDEVSFVPMEAVGEYGGMRLDAERRLDEVKSGFTYFRDEDVVVAKITPCFENGKGSIARNLANGVAFGTTELHVVRSGSDLDATFLFYLTISDAFRRLGASEMYGAGGQKRVPTDFVRDFPVGLPPLEEQRMIARFLDEQTEKIDDLIWAKRDLLALLREKRQAVITHAVTKGLDPAVKTKDSGVEWIGEIPEGWTLPKLNWVADISNGSTPNRASSAYWHNGSIPWLSSGKVNDYIVETPSELITQAAYIESRLKTYPVSTVIIGLVGQGKTRGMSAILNIEACINQNVAAIVSGAKLHPKFLLYWMRASYNFIREYGRGGNQEAMNCEIVSSLPICLPPKVEQRRIVAYLDTETGKLDALVQELEEHVALLQEYRSALISAAVTGKIDVRGATAQSGL